MSIHIASMVWRTELGGPSVKAVAMKLADHANDDGTGIHPSVARVARETENSERTVQYAIKALLEMKVLVVVKPGGKGGAGPQTTTHYRFNMEVLRQLHKETEAKWAAADKVRGAKSAPRNSRRGAKSAPQQCGVGVQNPTARGATAAPKPSVEPSLDRSARVRARLAERDFDDEGKKSSVGPGRDVSDWALDQVRKIAPGWDRQDLLRRFLAWPGSSAANDIDAAFLGWVRRVTHGRRPGDLPSGGARGSINGGKVAASKSMIRLAWPDPRWDAWLRHWEVNPNGMPISDPGIFRRSRQAFVVSAEWPPDSPEIEPPAASFLRWSIPPHTPEHSAWLAQWRLTDQFKRAQDFASREITTESRWPEQVASQAAE